MKKTVLTFLTILMVATSLLAQSIEEGKNFLYYERSARAKETLQQLVKKNPKDAQAIYWLGQALLAEKEIGQAKTLYQNALQNGVNDPYILVGMGHVELLSGGDINTAKQRFEQAITQSRTKKGDDPNVLLAIGRANADGSSKVGDTRYGIEKLRAASEIDKLNADIPYYIGINYLKMGSEHGGNAVEAFNEAIRRKPNDARSMYRIGRIYESQQNTELMNEWYGKAVGADPNFAPVYLTWFSFYSNRDVNAAKEYLDKYMNIVKDDKTCEIDFFYADYLFRAGKYQESIAKADEMANGSCKDFTKTQLLYAYNYDRIGDTMKAKQAIEKYFASTPEDKILPEHYVVGASVLKRFPGSEDQAVGLLEKVYEMDTIKRNKIQYADTIAYIYRSANRHTDRLKWLKTSWSLNPSPSNFDVYNMGEAALAAKDYVLADSMYALYRQKNPDQLHGYLGAVKVAQAKDSTGVAAVAPIKSYLTFMYTDTSKYKANIIYHHSLLASHYVNTSKDYKAALEEFKKAQALDPDNKDIARYIDQLDKALNPPKRPTAPKKPATPAKPKKQAPKK